MTNQKPIRQPFYLILIIILAGEAIFILPFVLSRIFGETFLEVFHLTNYQQGICFFVYGIVALISYLLGGGLADRFKPNILISTALILTAFGGFALATYPSFFILKVIFGYWGFTTIFLFWSPMIKATRIWGGSTNQGKAFGFLDGGRGLVAAGIGTIGILIYDILVGDHLAETTLEERKAAFSTVVITSSAIVGAVGVIVFFFLKYKAVDDGKVYSNPQKITRSDLVAVSKLPSVWWLMLIILCAYVGYKMTDNYALYASTVMKFDQIEATKIATVLLYLRPVVGVTIGFLADRTNPSKWMIIGFAAMIIGASLFSSGLITESFYAFFFLSLLTTVLGVYAVRVLYFAAMEEGKIPLALTGTAVGVISFVGYTPDIFFGLVKGYFLDQNTNITGHQHVFMFFGVFAILGLIASIGFYRTVKNK